MPHIIHRSQVPRGLRETPEKTYKRQLRRALASPMLSEEHRARLQAKLDRLLGTDTPLPTTPVPATALGAPDIPESPPAVATDSPKVGMEEPPPGEQEMLRLLKADIINIGKAEGAPVKSSMTKANLVAEILAHRSSG